jgi:hypothetical protein
MPATRITLTGPEPLEDRATPATLRIVDLPGGITGFGTAGTDPNNPSAQNSELVPASQLTVPFGPRELGRVDSPVAAASVLTISQDAPAGLFPTLGTAVPAGRLVFDLFSQAVKTGGGLSGGGATIYTYGLDPNVILEPITIEVVPDPGEPVGQPVRLSFGFSASASPAATQAVGVRQDAAFEVNGQRTSLLSRNAQAGDATPPLSGGVDVTVPVGVRFRFEFTQLASLAGVNAATTTARMVLGIAVASASPGAGVVGAGPGGGPAVNSYSPDGTLNRTFLAFEPAFTGGVRVATGNFNGDAVPDIVVGTGPGRATEVRVFDGATGAQLFAVQPFEAAFTGGVYVAAGSLVAGGLDELVVTPDEGGGPRVLVYQGATQVASFFGIDDPAFRGGARAAVGDVNHDGTADLVVAAGFGGGPRGAVYDGRTAVGGAPARLAPDFFVFEQALRNGVYVAVGDVNGDGSADLVFGGGPGGGPRVYVLSGAELVAGRTMVLANFFAGDAANRGGVRVAARDLDGDTRADLLTAPGIGSRARAYLATSLTPDGTPAAYRDFEPFPGLTAGVFVG